MSSYKTAHWIVKDAISRSHINKFYDLIGAKAGLVPSITDHFLLFNPMKRPLGTDGYYSDISPDALVPEKFKVPYRRRLWARGSITLRDPLHFGESYNCMERIQSVRKYRGDTFVSMLREIVNPMTQQTHLVEERTLVYTNSQPSPVNTEKKFPVNSHDNTVVLGQFTFTDLDIVRYSQLSLNPHRIHWDRPYTQQHEGYTDILAPGPLSTQLLTMYAAQYTHKPLSQIAYRNINYIHPGTTVDICARICHQTDTHQLYMRNHREPEHIYLVLDILA